jgi:hypothetical protein
MTKHWIAVASYIMFKSDFQLIAHAMGIAYD